MDYGTYLTWYAREYFKYRGGPKPERASMALKSEKDKHRKIVEIQDQAKPTWAK